MGDNQPPDPDKLQMWAKILAGMSYVVFGATARVAYDSQTRKLTRREIVIKFILCCWTGSMAYKACIVFGWSGYAGVIASGAALIGDFIIKRILVEWGDYLFAIFPWLKKKKQNLK